MKLKIFIITILFSLYGCKDKLKNELPFLLHYPNQENNSKLYPLVICLHDANGRGTDNLGRGSEAYKILTEPNQQKKTPAFVIIPQCPTTEKWVNCYWTSGNYDMSILQITDQLKFVNDLIDDLVKKHNIDPWCGVHPLSKFNHGNYRRHIFRSHAKIPRIKLRRDWSIRTKPTLLQEGKR